MHIPKCGGTSVIESFKVYFNPGAVFRLDAPASSRAFSMIENKTITHEQQYRAGLLTYAMSSEQYSFVCGHFLFNDIIFQKFKSDWNFITIVREPVSRFISHYFFSRYKNVDHYPVHEEIEKFLDTPMAKLMGNIILRYFSGDYTKNNYEQAKKNIDKFRIIGLMDRMYDFLENVKSVCGIQIFPIHINLNPLSLEEQKSFLTPGTIEKINILCQPDIELYNLIISMQSINK